MEFTAIRSSIFKCLNCSRSADLGATEIVCPQCGGRWPVQDAVPRFFTPDYYWGEHSQEQASIFLEEARSKGWRAAAKERFGNPEMVANVLDWQRASWLPLLCLGKDATALDIGCGHGAITNALAKTVGQVFSVDAIAERIEFTRIRLSQEGINNVQLVQATALNLPFKDRSFDCIITNGVLEWVGEWNDDGNPRDIQVQFLQTLLRLLKPGGTIVIGIENRFGHDLFRGGIDHSGLPYTSLVPRPVASWMLRREKKPHFRTGDHRKTEYRTYTYSLNGYRKLLREAGFISADFFWAEPGYNSPLRLIPLKLQFVRSHWLEMLRQNRRKSRGGLRVLIKKIFSGILPFFVTDFVIIAGAEPGSISARLASKLKESVPSLSALKEVVLSLATWRFGTKTRIRVYDSDSGIPRVMLKTSNVNWGGRNVLAEMRNVQFAKDRFQGKPISVPEPLGMFECGNFLYTAESVVNGRPLCLLLTDLNRLDRIQLLSEILPRCLDAIYWLNEATANSEPGSARAGTNGPRSIINHGDFTIENIFLNEKTRELTLIDWELLRSGDSPLYDLFTLLISICTVMGTPQDGGVPLETRFKEAFFGSGVWADLFGTTIGNACSRFELPPDAAWEFFIKFLDERRKSFEGRSSVEMANHSRYLEISTACQADFVADRALRPRVAVQ